MEAILNWFDLDKFSRIAAAATAVMAADAAAISNRTMDMFHLSKFNSDASFEDDDDDVGSDSKQYR